MPEFKIRIELDNLNYVSPVLVIEAKNWKDVCDQILGKIQIMDCNE